MSEKYFPGTGILTKDTLSSGERRIPIRPLGVLSDLVVGSLPMALALAKGGDLTDAKGLLDRAEEYAGDLQVGGLPQEGTLEHKIGRLDVLMLYAGLAHSGLRIKPKLSNLVRVFSGVQVPVLTYEDIVLNNPQSDPRTFTHGEIGADEEHFYAIHQDLEHAIKPAVQTIRGTLVRADIYGDIPQKMADEMSEASMKLDILIRNTGQVGGRMKLFDEFRPYLNPIPLHFIGSTLPKRDFPGPSGAYSGTVHALELLVCGLMPQEDGKSELLDYVLRKRRFIPTDDYDLLDEASTLALRGKALRNLAEELDYPDPLLDLLESFGKQILTFRRAHKGAVARQVPKALTDGTVMGTGGIINIGEFLDNRIMRTQNMLDLIKNIRTSRI